jgi:hypothetical protein
MQVKQTSVYDLLGNNQSLCTSMITKTTVYFIPFITTFHDATRVPNSKSPQNTPQPEGTR